VAPAFLHPFSVRFASGGINRLVARNRAPEPILTLHRMGRLEMGQHQPPRRHCLGALSAIFLAAALWPSTIAAQIEQRTNEKSEKLIVSAGHCPPFVIIENGQFTGLGIFLWERIAADVGIDYELRDVELSKMLASIAKQDASRKADLGISCLSVTSEREKLIDFSHSFYETYTGIAVRDDGITGTLRSALTNPVVLRALLFVMLMAALVGGLFYALEHRVNTKLYSMKGRAGRWLEALIVGALFVTRGPIRYYEFHTPVARILSAILAIGSTFLIAGITAVLAGAFTLENLQNRITGLQDLQRVRVGAMADSTSSAFLERHGIIHRRGKDLEELLEDLDRGRLDAVVSDEAFLRYNIRQQQEQGRYDKLLVLPEELETQNYGFGLQPDSPYLEPLNRALLEVRATPEWKAEVARYLGQ
jgi:polar amino acid transport system substrate-binding protein